MTKKPLLACCAIAVILAVLLGVYFLPSTPKSGPETTKVSTDAQVWDREYTSDQVLSVEMPGRPKRFIQTDETRADKLETYMMSLKTELRSFTIMATDVGVADDSDSINTALNAVALGQEIAIEKGGMPITTVQNSVIEQDGVAGRQIEQKSGPLTCYTKAFIVSGRLYQVQTTGPTRDNGDPAIQRFLGTIRIKSK